MGSQGNGAEVPNVLVQALLNRMDHLEFTLLRESSEDVSELRQIVGNIQRARRAQVEEVETARAPAPVATHRGPGSLPVPSAPPISIAESNALERAVVHAQGDQEQTHKKTRGRLKRLPMRTSVQKP